MITTVTDIPKLLTDLSGGSYRARRRAAISLLSMGPIAVDPLLNLLHYGSPRGQVEAVRTLGDLGDPRAVSDLLLALSSEDWRLAARAAHALGRLGNSRAGFALIMALGHPAPDVRYEAALALARLKIIPGRAYLEERLPLEDGLTSWGMPVVEGVRQALDKLPVP